MTTSRADRRWPLGFAAFAMLVTTVPYLLAFASAGDGWVFSGFLFGVDDGNSYIAKMLSGAGGAWLFRTPYTTFPQTGILAFLPYLLLGKLTAPPEQHLQLVVLFHLFRVLAGAASIVATYDFIAWFIEREPLRRWATALASLGGGLGWLLVLSGQGGWLGSLPLDFYSPETFGFLALYGLPHLAAGRALLLWGLLALLDGRDLRAGLLWLAGGLFNPLVIPIGLTVAGSHLALTLVRRGDSRTLLRTAVLAGLVTLPLLAYLVIEPLRNPFWREWTAQNKIASPHPLHYLVAFGFLLPWAVRGARKFLGGRDPAGWLPVAWVILLPFLAYAPLPLQRRLPEGLFVALVILAIKSLDSKKIHILTFSPFLLLFPSTLMLLAGGWMAASRPAPPIFLPAAEIEAFAYLNEIAEPGAVVLSPKDIGNALPAFVPLTVVVGHGPETVHFAETHQRVQDYFSGSLPPEAGAALLDDFGVRYVVGAGELPAGTASLIPIYQKDGYWIFEIRP